MKNFAYKTDQIVRYFSRNRVAWRQFYESERVAIDQLHLDQRHNILDIGCGCGGLGLALRDQFGVDKYTGVEINAAAVQAGRAMNSKAHIVCGDILELGQNAFLNTQFDIVFSLSCVDWNVRFSDMLDVAWNYVIPGGYLVATFRLTNKEGCNDFERSYQYINFDGVLAGERASYVVLNSKTLIKQLLRFDPSDINAYGYWGAPSATAVTPYERLCFAALSIQKRKPGDIGKLRCQLELPAEILEVLGSVLQCPVP